MAFRAVHEPRRLTQEDFLAGVRRDTTTRRAYLDGIISTLPPASTAHTRICANFMQTVQAQLKGSVPSCQVFSQPLLAVAPHKPYGTSGMFTYPDVVIVVGPPDYRDVSCTALWNPTVIVEVAAPATEDFDMGEKFRRYRHGLPTLQEYVLVAETRPEIGHYRAMGPEQWPLTSYVDLDSVLIFNRLPVRVALADVYKGVLAHTTTDAEPLPREEPAWQWYDR